ncbi:pyridoxamine 5'-phosphate oxidase family protein [Clostridium cylindrosporum]|uniref:Pyridoxamine 5'-phosphate oxidase n=1 Tax=Clostridium cylindrosporum DSM 605 TaxID=1121307 RepID=A0A0J8FZC6_CLOCY|nr:pyridoxamine 5'-phosphate oxidase family protein [Clostridium cylindrosporum]KMT20961.1 pyridoxamine 5'-phosphate oxidase [Clostridium cylindrosporum DSM 605]
MSLDKNFVEEYINKGKTIVLATIGNNSPSLRSLGGFVASGLDVIFATLSTSTKVKEIEENSNVSVFSQHENQELINFFNITIKGIANKIEEIQEIETAYELLVKRSPHLKSKIDSLGKESYTFFKVTPKIIKLLDFSRKESNERLKVINL